MSVRRAFQNKKPTKPQGIVDAVSSGKSESCHLMHGWRLFSTQDNSNLWDMYLGLLDISRLFLTDVSSDVHLSM